MTDLLNEMKLYLKVGHCVEDDLIESFIETAKEYIKQKTGVEYSATDLVYKDCMRMIVAYRYYNRNAIGEKNITEYPYSITEMLKTLSFRKDKNKVPEGYDGIIEGLVYKVID